MNAIKRILADPLLIRELVFRARRPGPNHWTYPGAFWYVLATLLPMALMLAFGGRRALFFFCLAAAWQVWLLVSRCGLYTSTSVASELEHDSLLVLVSSPLGVGRSVVCKLISSILPLFIEFAAGFTVMLLVYCLGCGLPWSLAFVVGLFQAASLVLSGVLGLCLGSGVDSADRVADMYYGAACLVVIGGWLGGSIIPDSVLVVACIFMALLVWVPRMAPRLTSWSSILALILIVALPKLYVSFNGQFNQSLSSVVLTPAAVVSSLNFDPELPKDLDSLCDNVEFLRFCQSNTKSVLYGDISGVRKHLRGNQLLVRDYALQYRHHLMMQTCLVSVAYLLAGILLTVAVTFILHRRVRI